MRARTRLLLAFGLLGWFLLSAAPLASAAGGVPAFDHIFVVVMENHSYGDIIGNSGQAPYINQLASNYGVAANSFGVAHPSLPNYLALVGGDTFGVTSDCTTCFVSAPNLVVDRIAASGRTWKAYMENMPSACFSGDAYPYAQKHNPFVYFDDLRTTSQCANVVPMTALSNDLGAASTTPQFVWITPNLCDDMHDCSIAAGDTWLSNTVPAILSSPAFTTQNSLLLITWDEDDNTENNNIPTLVVSPSVPAGYRSATPYNHYSLLKTIEQAWSLAPLTGNDAAAAPMSDFFSIVCVNAGGPAYTAKDGRHWQADFGSNAGRTYATTTPIAGTSDGTLYDSERYGTMAYSFSVPNGRYAVTLKFAELYWNSRGQRVFNVGLNGQRVLSNFDILAHVPKFTALDRTFTTSVTNGKLSIAFTTVADNAKVDAIEIIPTP